MSPRRVPPAESNALGPRALRWLHAWTGRHEYRPCRAIFRPPDASALDPQLGEFVGKTVTVRLVKAADASDPASTQPLYRIVSGGAPRHLLPERDFDFLE